MTTPTAPTVPLTRFGRRQTKGLLLGYSGLVVASVGTGVLVLALSMFAARIAGTVLTLPLWATLIAAGFVRWQGAPVIESAPLVVHWKLRKATGQTCYRVKASQPRPAGTMGLPGDAAALRFHEDTASGAAMVHDPHRQTLAVAVRVSHPAFVLLDPSGQRQQVNGWSRVLAGLAATGTCAAVQVLESVIPDPGRGVVGWWRENGIHDDSWAAREYETLMQTAAPSASSHRTLITLVLDMRKAGRAIKQAGRGMTGAAAVLAGDMANLAVALRNASLHVDGWLSATELAVVIRQTYDPALAIAPGEPGANLALGPTAVDEHWDHLRHDSGYSTVLWISDWPTADVSPSFLHALVFAPGIRRSLSLIAKPLGSAEAIRQIRKEKVDYLTDRHQKQKSGRMIDQSDDQEYADVLAREQALIAGHADMRYSGFVALTAPTLDELRAAVAYTQRVAAQCMLETRVLYGRQAQGFVVAALPLGRTVS
jgi:hypothetical protein